MLKVFVSSTTRDLERHRAAIKQIVLDLDWHPVLVNEHGGASTRPTMAECRRRLAECHLMVLVVAFRRGWVPTREEGGDGENSITALELVSARASQIPTIIFFADNTWPIGLGDQEMESDRAWIRRFRDGINQPVCFFSSEGHYTPLGEPIPGSEFIGKVRQELVKYWEQELRSPSPQNPEPVGRAGLQPLLPSLLPKLSDLLLPPHTILQEYRNCAPPDWPPIPANLGPRDLLICCAVSLATAPRQHNDRVPLLGFLNSLSSGLEPGPANQLKSWINEAITYLGINPTEPHQLQAVLSVPSPATVNRVTLMIQVEKDKFNRDSFRLKAWFLGTKEPPVRRSGDRPLSPDGLRQEVRELCEEVEGLCEERHELWIEFLLPRDLLGLDVDWWTIGGDLIGEMPLGTKHRAIIRPLDRHQLRKANIKQAWLRRWSELESRKAHFCQVAGSLHPPPVGPAVFVKAPGGNPLLSLLQNAPAVVFAVAECPLEQETDLLAPLLQAGIPATLWLRSGSEGVADLVERIKSLPLGELPHWVFALRNEAEGLRDPGHVGRRVLLLWDDPHRLSPEHDRDNSHPLAHPARLTGP
jgi:hypothetical protein